MQVHHGFDVDRAGADAVNDGAGKAVEVELAIVAPDFASAFRLGQDAPQRSSIFLKKVAAQLRLAFLIPKRGGFQLLRNFRMPDDAYGAWPGCPGSSLPLAGHPPGPRPSRGSAGQ